MDFQSLHVSLSVFWRFIYWLWMRHDVRKKLISFVHTSSQYTNVGARPTTRPVLLAHGADIHSFSLLRLLVNSFFSAFSTERLIALHKKPTYPLYIFSGEKLLVPRIAGLKHKRVKTIDVRNLVYTLLLLGLA